MKTVTIEDLLSWAFVHELPKGGGVDGLSNANSAWRMLEASSWGKITDFALLGTMIDSHGGGSNYWIDQGEPHEDAVTVGRAVADLGGFDVDIPAGWNPLTDWPGTEGLAEHAVARTVAQFRGRTQPRRAAGIINMIVGTAILGRDPSFASEPSKVRMVERHGRPAWFMTINFADGFGGTVTREVDGYNARSHRPMKDAYRKQELSTDPTADILGRLDYQIWIAALRHLQDEIGRQLIGQRLYPCERSMTPWLDADLGGLRLVKVAGSGVVRPAKKMSTAR